LVGHKEQREKTYEATSVKNVVLLEVPIDIDFMEIKTECKVRVLVG
jgi:hypothetical protein